MKTFTGALVASSAALMLVGCGTPTMAKNKIDPNKLTKVECSSLHFSDEFLAKYPDAPKACIEAREYNGKKYAKFKAKVYLNSADRTTVTLQSPQGEDLSTFSIKPGPDLSVNVKGTKTRFVDLHEGDPISFWVSEDRMSASEVPGSTDEQWAVLPPIK
jgi:hypothetical protein